MNGRQRLQPREILHDRGEDMGRDDRARYPRDRMSAIG
jgi:hypothetical protein